MSIDDILTGEASPHYTEQRPIFKGLFHVSKAAIPYFQGTMRLEDAAKELQLVENLPADLRARWRLEELFQREIDWLRVETDIVKNYLRRPEKLQFFNALTVALLPLDENRLLAASYGVSPNPPAVPPQQAKAPWAVTDIGGVQLVTNSQTPHGYVRWDPRRIFPATIDGQHRLAALQKLVQEGGHLTSDNLATSISVIFLVLDSRAGLKLDRQHESQDNPILGVVREVFIDLNKHAQPVNRSRQILLDDQDIESRCVRRLLAQRVGEEEAETIPLGLVHWQHRVTAKFNAGEATAPFVTTVELLYSIVQDILDIAYPKDPFDERLVRKFVDSVEDALAVSRVVAQNQVRYPLPPLIKYVESNYLVEDAGEPFANLPPLYLRAADDGFAQTWRPIIVGVLKRFKPYSDFIAEVRKRGGIDGDLAFYLTLPSKAQAQKRSEWGESRAVLIDTPLKQLAAMKLDDWPFFAVFQKGLMKATADAWRHANAPVRGAAEGPQASMTVNEFLDVWIPFLDSINSKGLFAVKVQASALTPSEVWSGIALNPGSRTVKWTAAAADRIANLLLAWWYVRRSHRDASSFIHTAESKTADVTYPGMKKAIQRLRKALEGSVMAAVPEEEVDEAVLAERAAARLTTLIGLALPG